MARPLGQRVVQLLLELSLGLEPDDLADLLAVLEDEEGRDAPDAVLGGCAWIVVRVELAELDLTVVLLSELVDDGSDHATRATPGGPEVDEDRLVSLQNVAVPAAVGG